jgi:prepilin-type N-terminal cleavage/methylation domain-containing protein
VSADKDRFASRGYSLTEVLLVIMVIGILSGMVMLSVGSSNDSARASAIMADLESAKSAVLAYSMANSTRASDGITTLVGGSGNDLAASLDRYFDRRSNSDYFRTLNIRQDGRSFIVEFNGFPANPSVQRVLNKKITQAGATFSGSGSGSTYTLGLRVK